MTGVSECSQQRGNLKDDGYSDIGKKMPIKAHQKTSTRTARINQH
ncbi:hypothetical protein [Photorhabdus bodei]|nr:hypothetical protein [Photorhabdus bodei]